MLLGPALGLSAILFSLGVAGVLLRRNAIVLFMCIELMLNAVNLTFVALAQLHGASGYVMVFFVMTVAAAEAAVGLAIIIGIFRHKQSVDLGNINLLRGADTVDLARLAHRRPAARRIPGQRGAGAPAAWSQGPGLWVGVGVLLGAFAVALGVFVQLWLHPPHAPIIVNLWRWLPVGPLQIDFAFQVDQLSAVMLLVVTGVGSLIHLFSVGYMKEDPGYARYFAYLNLFVVFMLVLVLGSSFPVMFIGWEGVGLCSYLLIGFWFSDKVNADAGKKAFIVNRIGDFGFMIAMFLIWQHLGTLTFTGMVERAPAVFSPGTGVVTAITLFLFLGCTGKSAQIPLYTWLPDAMAGSHAGLGPDPCGHHGHRRCLPGGPDQRAVRAGAALEHGRGRHRGAHRPVRRHDRPAPVRHQEGAGLLHGLPAGLHVPRRGHRRLRVRRLPPGDPRLLQGAALPRRRQRDPRHASRLSRHPLACRRPGHAQHGRPQAVHAGHLLAHVDRHPRHRRHSAVLRVLLQGRDPRRRLRPGR